MGYTRFYWVLLGFTGFQWFLSSCYVGIDQFSGVCADQWGLVWFYRVVIGFNGLYWVSLGFTGFQWLI